MQWRSALLVLTAPGLAVAIVQPQWVQQFPLSVIGIACHFADTLFHEIGHALFAWAFGQPSIPAIFTLFGSDQAGGMALTFDHNWMVQGMVWAGMAYGCWWLLQEGEQGYAYAAVGLSVLLFALSFWRHHLVIGLYMGHGSAIVMGCFFLYRGLLGLAARGVFERWLNLFLGCVMLLKNAAFAWRLAFDEFVRAEYSERLMFGAAHHDFMAMSEEWPVLTVQGIAFATVVFILVATGAVLALAYIRRNDYGDV